MIFHLEEQKTLMIFGINDIDNIKIHNSLFIRNTLPDFSLKEYQIKKISILFISELKQIKI